MNAPAYRINGHEVPPAQFYAAACDPRRSVVVEACAGAGKTWMLVSRMLRALLDGAQPQQILAITFTRKAAGEMRERLADWLREFASPDCSDTRREAELLARGLDATRARALAPALADLHQRVLQAGRPVQIHTFHAWFSQLLRAAPLVLLDELGLSPQMELVEDPADHLPEVHRRFHAALLAEPVALQTFRDLVARRGRSQVRRWLDAAWDKRIEFELADAAGTLESSVPAPAVLWPGLAGMASPAEALREPGLQTLLQVLARRLGASGKALQLTAANGLIDGLALADTDANGGLERVWKALCTDGGEPRKRLGDHPEHLQAVESLAPLRLAQTQQAAHEEHLAMVLLARRLLGQWRAYKQARGLADMADLERCALALLRDSSLSGWVQERLDARIQHLLIDEFQDTSPLQWHALRAWLSAYAGAGGGASGQRPPGVFVVGDPKQSIYRFRRAEPRVFAAARDFVVDALDGQVLACDHTRRNAPAVLAAVNRVFEAAQAQGDYPDFRPHSTEPAERPGPPAGVWTLPRVLRSDAPGRSGPVTTGWRNSLLQPRQEPEFLLRQQEADRVADTIAQLVQQGGFRPGEVKVLCRKRASLRLLAQALQRRHIPFAAADDAPLLEAPEARDLLALLDALASPAHALSLAQALRSPLFGVADSDLVWLAQRAAGDTARWWPQLLALDPEGVGRVDELADEGAGSVQAQAQAAASATTPAAEAAAESVPASPALCRAARLLRRWQLDSGRLPPHDLLDRIVAEGELRERLVAAVPAERVPMALAAVDALLAQSLALDGARYATPYNLVRALKRRTIKVAAPRLPNTVQLLTVHGAKGLEARAVFVMDSDPELRNTDSASLLVDWPVEAEHPRCCAFIYAEGQCPPSLLDVLAQEVAARAREELNGLYVAMTRAREQLVFSATEPFRAAGGAWWQRLQAVAQPWDGVPGQVQAGVSGAAVPPAPGVWALPLWVPPAMPARPEPPPGVEPLAAVSPDTPVTRLGQAVHRVLEWAAGAGPSGQAQWPAWSRAAAREFGVDAALVLPPVQAILGSADCAVFFDPARLAWAGNEVPVSSSRHGPAAADAGAAVGRIDRLVALDGPEGRCWWVLDYKLGKQAQQSAANHRQLLAYQAEVQRLQPGDRVRCAFITGRGQRVELVLAEPSGVPAGDSFGGQGAGHG